MNIGELCIRETVIARRSTPLNEAARLMREYHVGCLVIADEGANGNVPVGLLTDRDIVVEAVAADLDCRALLVGEVMSAQLVTAKESDPVSEVLSLMRAHGVRRMPVLTASGTLAGIASLDDILEMISEEMEEIHNLILRERATESAQRPSSS